VPWRFIGFPAQERYFVFQETDLRGKFDIALADPALVDPVLATLIFGLAAGTVVLHVGTLLQRSSTSTILAITDNRGEVSITWAWSRRANLRSAG
jgi:hypothetical protein